MSKQIIGITGLAGAGKSTVAQMIADVADPCTEAVIPFAKALKAFATDLGWDGNKDVRGRALLQRLGTDVARECIHPDIWVRHWEAQADINPAELIIADDVRFDNEVKSIRQRLGIIVKVVGRESNCPGDTKNHSSEVIPEYSDYVIHNNASMMELSANVANFWFWLVNMQGEETA